MLSIKSAPTVASADSLARTSSSRQGIPAAIELRKAIAMTLAAVTMAAASAGADAQGAPAPEGAQAGGIQEVLVTARRREESLQEVPLTVAAFTSEDLENQNIDNVQDLALLVPNMVVTGGGTAAGTSNGEWRVRGVPGVARYIDGIYLGSTRASLQSVVELERVEVLRGPQGTLFGKGAIGGAVNFVTKDPASVFGARVKTTMGSHDRFDVTANVDLPLSDTVLTKFTGISLKRGGYVQNVYQDRTYGGTDEHQFRATMLWTPTADLTIRLAGTSLDITDDGDPNVLWAVYPEVVNGVPNDTYAINWLIQNGYVSGTPLTNDTLPGKFKSRSNQQVPSFDHEEIQFTTDVTYDISDSMSIKWLGGYKTFEGGQFSDADASEHVLFDNWGYTERDELTTELQLSGSGDRYDWVLGLFYTESDSKSVTSRWENIEANRPANLAALRAAFPALVRFNTNNTRLNTPSDNSQAIFGEGTYNFTDKFAVTLGLRYSMDEVSPKTLTPCTQPPAYMDLTKDFSACGVLFSETAEFEKLTPRVSVKYQWSSDVMTYVTYSQGFDGGGINNTPDRRVPPQLPNGGFFPYDPQLFTNYELGVRTDLLNGRLRLNGSAFYGEWSDMQVNEELIPGQSGRWISNAGAAEVQGIEIEGITQIGDAVRLNFAAAWLDTTYTDLGTAQNIAYDTPFPFSPEWSFSVGGQYELGMASGASLRFRTDYGWVDETETNQDFLTSITREAYGLLSAGITYTPESDQWEVTLSGTNLTDEYYRQSGFLLPVKNLDFGTVAPPAEFALSFRFTFE